MRNAVVVALPKHGKPPPASSGVGIVDQIDQKWGPLLEASARGLPRAVPQLGQHPASRVFVLTGQEIRVAARAGRALPAGAVRQSGHG